MGGYPRYLTPNVDAVRQAPVKCGRELERRQERVTLDRFGRSIRFQEKDSEQRVLPFFERKQGNQRGLVEPREVEWAGDVSRNHEGRKNHH